MKKHITKIILLGITGISMMTCYNPFLNTGNSKGHRKIYGIYYVVTFDAGDVPAPGAQNIAKGQKIAKVPVVSRNNSGFGGWWYTDSASGINREWDFANDTVQSDITLYAKWDVSYYTVQFFADSGTPAPANQLIMSGAKITEPAALRRGDDGFGGWYTEPGFINQWDFAVDTVPSNISLYAKWDISYCTVTFEANGGLPAPRNQDLAIGIKIVEPTAMNQDGCGFGGWYTDAGFSREWDFTADIVNTSTLTLYAKWVINEWTVTFNTNGGRPVPQSQKIAHGTKIAKPLALTNPGKGFSGWWYTDPVLGDREWDFEHDTVSSNMTLFATWETVYYVVTFDTQYTYPLANQTTPVPPNQLIAPGTKATEPPPPAKSSRPYLTFAGWFDALYGGIYWDFDDPVNADLDLHAYWVFNIDDFVWVPTGSFIMGDNSISGSLPAHKVKVEGFYIGKNLVTQQQYIDVMGPAANHSNFNGLDHPVDKVTWYDAVEYCNRRTIKENLSLGTPLVPAYSLNGQTNPDLWGPKPTSSPSSWDSIIMNPAANGYRLPTEAEWEYAARGGKGSPGNYTYSGSNNADVVAIYTGNSGSKTAPVMSKAPNNLGIYDMSGNLSEWCWDWYDGQYYSSSPMNNPLGPGSSPSNLRVRRGGSWNNAAANVRTVVRSNFAPGGSNLQAYWVLGFRVVRGPQEVPEKY